MKISVLQLNIEKGRRFDELIAFIKQNDIDILQLQEVASGAIAYTHTDIFTAIKQELNYVGELAVNFRIQDSDRSYFGNATFWKKSFRLNDVQTVWMKEYKEYTPKNYQQMRSQENYQNVPRNVLHVTLEKDKKNIHLLNTYLVWGPTPKDMKYKQKQHEKIISYTKSLPQPFILSGDFNIAPDTHIIHELNTLAVNLNQTLGYPNTLNPRLHRLDHIFPGGIPVDYMYISRDITAHMYRIVDTPDLSDHYGILAHLEIS